MSPKSARVITVVFYVTVLALLTFGFVMLTSASSSYAYRGDPHYFAKRQAMWLGLGLVACAGTARIDYRLYRKFAWPLFITSVVLLAGVLVVGKPINGAARWFVYGPIRFQPSEFAKYALVIFLAFWLEKMQRAPKGRLRPRIEHWWWGVFAPLTATGGLTVFILVEPDLGILENRDEEGCHSRAACPHDPRQPTRGRAGHPHQRQCHSPQQQRCGMFNGSYQVQRILHWWRQDDLTPLYACEFDK